MLHVLPENKRPMILVANFVNLEKCHNLVLRVNFAQKASMHFLMKNVEHAMRQTMNIPIILESVLHFVLFVIRIPLVKIVARADLIRWGHVCSVRLDTLDGSLPECIACSQTEISINNQTECEICEDGKRRSGNECQDCAIGSSGTGGQCVLCQLAKYQDVAGASECKTCPSGKTTRSVGHSAASDCQSCIDLGKVTSTIILGGVCTNCAPGKYVDVDVCTNCEPGRYRLASQTECEKCIAGKFSDGSSPCADCPVGFYNTAEGLSQCEQCITQGAHSNSCEECTAGYRKEGSSCIACEAGKFSVTGQVECQECALGLFQDQTSSPSCKQCLPGTFADDLSSFVCTLGRFQPEYGQGACHVP